MNTVITRKMILEMCGPVSLKRGEAFSKNHKVIFKEYRDNYCEAFVQASEDFAVMVAIDGEEIKATCSCPKLASFQKECQHIAAVLVEIKKFQMNGKAPSTTDEKNMDVSGDFFALFNQSESLSTKQQRHFEKREVIPVEFMLKVIPIDSETNLFGIEIQLLSHPIKDIRLFLKRIKSGKAYSFSSELEFNPKLHCVKEESEAILQELGKVIEDERIFLNHHQGVSNIWGDSILLIPPSSWIPLRSHWKELGYYDPNKGTMVPLNVSNEVLPLRFHLYQREIGSYQLNVHGMESIQFLHQYYAVLIEGNVRQLEAEDFKRLIEIKKMMEKVGESFIPIALNQLDFFLEKVAPSLKKLGEVQLERELSKKIGKTPLQAELYLDRVNNRLLASLEFRYDHIVINPVQERDKEVEAVLLRDWKKEEQIKELMDSSSFAKTDSGYMLYNEELEFDFLYYVLPKLQKLVKVYATTAIRNRIFKEKTWPRFSVKLKKDRINWLEFKFEMEGFPEREIKGLLAALEEKRKYYRLQDGSLFALQTREMEEVQRYLQSPQIKDKDFISGFELTLLESLSFIEEDRKIFALDESYQQLIDSFLHPEKLNIKVPADLNNVLKTYQKDGYKWLKTLAQYQFGGILADDMGLGKTLQSIAFIQSELPVIRKAKQPVLVVCPSSLLYNWQREIMKFAPAIQCLILDGVKKERAALQKDLENIDVIITSYPLVRQDISWYEQQVFHTVLFDEAQYFKNPLSQTAKAVKKLKAVNRFALTGTPLENSIEELWSIFHIVFPELFKGLKEFANLTNKQIAKKIRPFMLRRLKEDVLAELPEKREWSEIVELLPEQKRLYAAYLAKLRHDALKHLNKETLRKNKIRILAGLTRLRQICCHPALFVDNYHGKSAKLDHLMELIEEAQRSNRRVLIFSQFTSMLEIIGQELAKKGLAYFYLDGSTPSDERVELCHRYNLGERDYFLISLKAGGTGLNLMTADTVILYDTWWNPAVEEQAADRAHRIGQENVVNVIKLFSKGTIEEKIYELQEKKKNLVDEIIDSDDKVISSLTEEDLRELLS
ncbi:helicase SNF [Niallia circulans]|uniref:Helicase SNF n=1 Tax=Niallia circulans TaxID=1397 RepID=A0AA91TNQ3_NIACI|nr:DEAD/DEAH box helicase [Niallia circulans]PAD81373.1 helicase SNF [Niallia circulans]